MDPLTINIIAGSVSGILVLLMIRIGKKVDNLVDKDDLEVLVDNKILKHTVKYQHKEKS